MTGLAKDTRQVVSPHDVDTPSHALLQNCIHCGLCLPHCPTYALTGLEKSSPRGRIRLMKSVTDGEMEITKGYIEEMEFCLGCLACETACPASVQYGAFHQQAISSIHNLNSFRIAWRKLLTVFMLTILAKKSRTRLLAIILKIYQVYGFQWLVEQTGILKSLSKHLYAVQKLAPQVHSSPFSLSSLNQYRPYKKQRYRIGFFTGCIMDVAYPDIHHDSVELLRKSGCEVIVPRDQGCCGALHAHSGDVRTAKLLALANVKAFEDETADAVLVNSAGCSAFMKSYGELLQHEHHELVHRSKNVARRVTDIAEFLHGAGFRSKSSCCYSGKRVTYHDACHHVHAQKIYSEPRDLIKSVPGIDFVEMPESTWCCGSAGIYNITHSDDALKLLQRKLSNIISVKPDIVITGNPGCLAQLRYGLQKEGMMQEVLHIATFLHRAS